MTIKECISRIDNISDNSVIYAKRIDELFTADSETVILELTEEEQYLPLTEIIKTKCPGFDYFLEVFIIKEVMEGMDIYEPDSDLTRRTERIIYYAENDA